MELVEPGADFESSYRAYIEELGNEVRYPFPLDFEHDDFPALLVRLSDLARGRNIPEGFVPSSTYWLVAGSELLGVSNLRHYLNESIRRSGGHIGLGIRPSARGRGLGSYLMSLTTRKAFARGIRAVHVHCYKDNEPSARMILASGGVLDSEVQESSGNTVQRYVIRRS